MGYHAYEPFITDLSTAATMKLKPRMLATGDDLILYANVTDSIPTITLKGNNAVEISTTSYPILTLLSGATTMFNFRGENTGGNLSIKESTAAPTNVADFAQLFTKSDNKLYYVDGDGATKEVATV